MISLLEFGKQIAEAIVLPRFPHGLVSTDGLTSTAKAAISPRTSMNEV